jgi:membrane-associated protein
MSELLTPLLTFLQSYGYPALWLSVFIAAIGVPLPTALVLLAAGAFAELGDFNIALLFIIAFSALVCGDSVGYLIGRRWGSKVLDRLEHSKHVNRVIPPRTFVRSRNYFQHRGGWAIFFSRFLITVLGGIINLLAGSELYPYRYFLFSDIAGEALGALIPLALGYVFETSWEAVGDVLGSFSFLILALIIVILLVVRLLRNLRSLQRAQASKIHQPVASQSGPVAAPATDPPTGASGQLPLL